MSVAKRGTRPRSEHLRDSTARPLNWIPWAVCLDMAILFHGLMIAWIVLGGTRADQFWSDHFDHEATKGAGGLRSSEVDTSALDEFQSGWWPIELFVCLCWVVAIVAVWWFTMHALMLPDQPQQRTRQPRRR